MGKDANDLNRVLKMIVNRRLDEAEREIESFKPSDDYEKGYLRGLKGIIHSLRKPVEGSIVESGDPKAHLKSMMESVNTHLLNKEEEGYFTAWLDFLKKLSAGKKDVVKEKPSEQPG
ncbi:MAG: hypothetical protein QXS51_02735 [Thermoproteota archaeon]|nr:hypothetical protein [Candidatus Brockarchaeota archaeon]